MCGSPLHRPMIPNREIGKAGFRIFSFVAVCRLSCFWTMMGVKTVLWNEITI